MTLKERYAGVIEYFEQHMPHPETELYYRNPYELLVAVILSAQCTDKRVNMVTPELFERYPDARILSKAEPEQVFEYIRSISYPNNKAKHLVGMAQMLVNDFHNEVPDTVEKLVKMPGVGRKTANVIASVIHNQPTMAVDTHVFRVSHRLGLVTLKAKTPLLVEKELVAHLSVDVIPKAHHWLILHGRYTCMARNPQCQVCGITQYCASYPRIQREGIAAVDKALPKIN